MLIFFKALVGVRAAIWFDDTINAQSGVSAYSHCHNCSLFTGEPILFPCLRLFGLEWYSVPRLFEHFMPFILGINNNPVSRVDLVNVTIEGPDVSYFEAVNQSWGYAMQVIYSLWYE